MKQLIKLSIISGMLLSTTTYSLNPIQGFYAGLMAGISSGPSEAPVTFEESGMLFTGKISYSPIAALGAGYLGYKLGHFRLEGEILYNRFSTGPLTVGTCTLQSPGIFTPTGECPQPEYDHFRDKGLGYNGSSAALYGLVNVYYDFFSWEGETFVVPYLGLGVGQAQITNRSNFLPSDSFMSHGQSSARTTPAGQIILGLSYYMDDFTWAGMDYRYLSTQSIREMGNKRYALNTLNFNINFAFDKGGFSS